MKKAFIGWGIALSLVFCLAWFMGPDNEVDAQVIGQPVPILCNQSTQGSTSTTIATSIPNRSIVICGWDIDATVATTSAFSLLAGTGGACATPTKTFVVYSALPAAVTVDHIDYAFTQAPIGSDLCVTDTTANWTIYWGQF